MSLTVWSYLAAAVACALVAARLPSGLGDQGRHRVRTALWVCCAWALFSAGHAAGAQGQLAPWLDRSLTLVLAIRYGALLAMFEAPRGSWLHRLNRWGIASALVLAVVHLLIPALVGLHSFTGLLLALLGLVNVEQLIRNAPAAASRATKFLAVGIGGQVAFDLFLFSQAQLLGALDADAWTLRGFVVAALIPLVDIGLRRRAQDMPTLFVSRQVVFYTSAFLSVGIYLMVMALGGYYVRLHGGIWGESLRLLFFVGAGVVLALLLLSPMMWRRWRVFVAKHFYRNKYDYRVEWLRFIDTLSATESGDARVTSIRAIAQIFESPGGLLFLRDEGGDRFESAADWFEVGLGERSIPGIAAQDDLPRFLADRQWVVDLQEYHQNPALYRNIEIPAWLLAPSEGWRIVSPLFELERLVGFLVLQSPPDPFQMTFEDRDLLRTAGRHVATLLAQQAADRKLVESRQFDAFNRFGAFVMHDLKNSVAQLQLIVDNASRHRGNPEFMDDAIETIGNTAARMTRLIEQLQTRDSSSANRPVELATLLRAVSKRSAGRPPGLHYENDGAEAGRGLVLADPDRLGAVIEHVIRNAQEAAGAGGRVSLGTKLGSESAVVTIQDDGPGMDAAFIRDRLFRPFDSTKGSKGMGVGAYQVREYVRQIGGTVEVQSIPGQGTLFLITLPLCQTTSPAS